ncbi:MAG: PD40 domain-containing protein [Gemmatimonadetes bacterium]|nr:PD40 domain-containing protein [Gemmatimonadota bacterium]
MPALQAQARPLSASDMFTIETASDPQISPDGLWVAYVRNWSDAITDKRYSNIWLVKSDGTGHRPVTSGKTHDASPRWSPDGTRLAYTSDKGGSGQLYVRWNDTGESIALTNGAIPPAGPTWSPDGVDRLHAVCPRGAVSCGDAAGAAARAPRGRRPQHRRARVPL